MMKQYTVNLWRKCIYENNLRHYDIVIYDTIVIYDIVIYYIMLL